YFVLVALKDRKPGIRYRVSLLFMMISVSVTSLTFVLMYRKLAAMPVAPDISTLAVWWMPEHSMEQSSGLWQSVLDFLQTNVTSLTYMYMIGVVLLLLRMGINFWSLNRIKT